MARLVAATRFAESAHADGLHTVAAFVLSYDAARNALAAVLSSAGRRVGDGRGSHALTIREAGKLLAPACKPALVAIEAARIARNRTEYDGQPVTTSQLESIRAATAELLAVATAFVAARCP